MDRAHLVSRPRPEYPGSNYLVHTLGRGFCAARDTENAPGGGRPPNGVALSTHTRIRCDISHYAHHVTPGHHVAGRSSMPKSKAIGTAAEDASWGVEGGGGGGEHPITIRSHSTLGQQNKREWALRCETHHISLRVVTPSPFGELLLLNLDTPRSLPLWSLQHLSFEVKENNLYEGARNARNQDGGMLAHGGRHITARAEGPGRFRGQGGRPHGQ